MRTVAVASLLFGSFYWPAALAAATFSSDSTISSDTGYALIEWDGGGGPVTLEMAREPDFSDARPIYRGEFESYFISGLADGEYHLRLREQDRAPSPPLLLTVEHQSLTQAIWLMIAGALVTIGIVATIWRGARDD